MFKLNDTIILVGCGLNSGKTIAQITKITKTGQFETNITGSTKFNQDGSQRGRDVWRGYRAVVATEKEILTLQEIAEKKELINKIKEKVEDWKMLPSCNKEKLSKILEALNS